MTPEELTQFFDKYFARQSDFDGDGMLEFWHSDGMMYLVGNENQFRVVCILDQIGHIKEAKKHRPDMSVEFTLDEIEQITTYDELIASVHVRYRMIFPGGYGQHRCFYNLAKIDGKWLIANAVDRGLQVLPEE